MNASVLKLGRTFGITFEHGNDFLLELKKFCRENYVKQGYVSLFQGDFSELEIVGTCLKRENPEAPMLESKVYLENVEAMGFGTIAYDNEKNEISPHFHVSAGKRLSSGEGYTSHFIQGKVQFVMELIFVEVLSPSMERILDENTFNLKLLNYL